MDANERRTLALALLVQGAAGSIPSDHLLAALRDLLPAADGEARNVWDLHEACIDAGGDALRSVAEDITTSRIALALRAHSQWPTRAPQSAEDRRALGLRDDPRRDEGLPALPGNEWQRLRGLLADWHSLDGREDVPGTRAVIEAEIAAAIARLTPTLARYGRPAVTTLLDRSPTLQHWSSRVDELTPPRSNPIESGQALTAAPDAPRRRQALEALLNGPSEYLAIELFSLALRPTEQAFCRCLLTFRFGRQGDGRWEDWQHWARARAEDHRRAVDRVESTLTRDGALTLAALAWGHTGDVGELLDFASRKRDAVAPQDLAMRWSHSIPHAEWRSLMGMPTGQPVPAAESEPSSESAADAEHPERMPAPPAETAPETAQQTEAKPDFWSEHLRPFVTENLLLVAGLIMVLGGSSVLAAYTWDKHWALRYTLMPGVLAIFTFLLARLGTWLERRDDDLAAPATMLRGAAVALLPMNFMAVALLAADDQVTLKPLVVPLMALAYGVVFGIGLRHWCRAVNAALSVPLGNSLLALNALVLLSPLASSIGFETGPALRTTIGLGFYVGFGVLAWCTRWLTRQLAADESLRHKHVLWFTGFSLVLTYLQVFAWVHGHLGVLPAAATYAPLVVLTGWLILDTEARALALREGPGRYQLESFVGFAALGLGVLLSLGNEWLRILSLALAGIVWLFQARPRHHEVHYWIGLVFVAAAGACFGLLSGFPRAAWPALILVLAFSMQGWGTLSRRLGVIPLRRACLGMEVALLHIAVVVAVVAQWRSGSAPGWTALWLALTAGQLLWRGSRDVRVGWILSGALVAALALPYVGFVDMSGRHWHGNHLVFGLAVLSLAWAGLLRAVPNECLRTTRSSVPFAYAILALIAMLVRVGLEAGRGGEASAWHVVMDYSGPLLIAALLAVVTYWSRSLLPAAVAAVICVILFPELKARFASTFDRLSWGSGLGGSLSALGLVIVCFRLRSATFLRDLGEGDPFLHGGPFPLRRFDHRLFTWPLLASALFLAGRIEAWTWIQTTDWRVTLAPRLWQTVPALLFVAITWILTAAYHRRGRRDAWRGHLAWIAVALAAVGAVRVWWPDALRSYHIVVPLVMLHALRLFYRYVSNRNAIHSTKWCAGALRRPLEQCFWVTSCALVPVAALRLLLGGAPGDLLLLTILLVAQSAPLAVKHESRSLGIATALLFWIGFLTWSATSFALPWAAASDRSWLLALDTATLPRWLWGTAVIGVGLVLFDRAAGQRRGVRQLTAPLHSCLIVTSFLFFLAFVVQLLDGSALPVWRLAIPALLTLGIVAIVQGCWTWLLWAGAVLWLWVLHPTYGFHGDPEARLQVWIEPRSLVVLALLWSAAPVLVRWSGLLTRWRLPRPSLGAGSPAQLLGAAFAIGVLALFSHALIPSHRQDASQMFCAWGLVVPFWLIARQAWPRLGYNAALLALMLANIHAVRLWAGDELMAVGLREANLIALAIAATLLIQSGLSRLVGDETLRQVTRRFGLFGAALVLVIIALNYVAHPDLETITWQRYLASGLIALVAGWHFRRAVRQGKELALHPNLGEAVYHVGVAIACWCGALMIPALRGPTTSGFVLALPALLFWLRTETTADPALEKRYRHSTGVLATAIVGLIVFRYAFSLLLYGDDAADDIMARWRHYHSNAPVLILLGLALLRLRGLGGTRTWALIGGTSALAGLYLAVTAVPGWSPFTHPLAAAFVGIAFAHLATLVTDRRSSVRHALIGLLQVDAEEWNDLRRAWGILLLAAVHVLTLLAVTDPGVADLGKAPLLVALATVLLHHGFLRASTGYVAIYAATAVAEIGIAVHGAWLWPGSLLAKTYVAWVVLGAWAAILTWNHVGRRWPGTTLWPSDGPPDRAPCGPSAAAMIVAILVGHQFWHGPGSNAGVFIAVASTLLLAGTTRSSAMWPAVLTGAAVLWSGFWWGHALSAVHPSIGALLGTGAVLLVAAWAGPLLRRASRPVPDWGLIGNQVLAELRQRTILVPLAGAAAFGVLMLVQGLFVGGVGGLVPASLSDGHAWCAILLDVALAWLCLREGRARKHWLPVLLSEAALGLALTTLRLLIARHAAWWRPEHDVWAVLLLSVVVAGAKGWWHVRPPHERVAGVVAMVGLPLFAMSWVLLRDLGTDFVLVVVGLYTVLYAWLGGLRRESPYHAVAVIGFVSFVVLAFSERLELRVAQAYTIPIGVGVLALLQLFKERVPPETRTMVRLLSLLLMLGSSAWYAVLDDAHPIAFHLCVLLLSLAAMVLGGVLRIRLYVVLGFAGVLLAVGSLVFKAMAAMDRGTRMTIIGGLILLIGAAVVTGAVVWKAHRERIVEKLGVVRDRLGRWE